MEMVRSRSYLIREFLVLFVVLPLSLVLPYFFILKVAFTLIGFIYVVYILHATEEVEYRVKRDLNWKHFWKRFVLTSIFVVVSTVVYMYLMEPTKLFYVPLKRPLLFLIILFSYTLLSAWPQEILFRTFFFSRYQSLFNDERLLIFTNAILFSLAHLFFRNALVLLITLIGGLIFAFTYLKFRSTTLVTIEHAIYGNWLYAVGLGYILDFPGFDSA